MRTRASRPRRSTALPRPNRQSKRSRTEPESEVFPMHHPAPNPAAQPHLSLNPFSAPSASREESNGGGEIPSFLGAFARSLERLGRTSAAENERVTRSSGSLPSRIPPFARSLLRGLTGALRLGVALLWLRHPFRVSVPPRTSLKTRGNKRRSNFFRAPPRKHSLALGSRAHFAY